MKDKKQYECLVGRLREHHRIMGDVPLIDIWKKDMGLAADAIEELLVGVEQRAETICVETPLGTLAIFASTDPAHPGVYVDLRRKGVDYPLQLVLVEFTADDNDEAMPEQGGIVTRVWGNAEQEDYTERVVHEKIEDYFKVDDGQGNKTDEDKEQRK